MRDLYTSLLVFEETNPKEYKSSILYFLPIRKFFKSSIELVKQPTSNLSIIESLNPLSIK